MHPTTLHSPGDSQTLDFSDAPYMLLQFCSSAQSEMSTTHNERTPYTPTHVGTSTAQRWGLEDASQTPSGRFVSMSSPRSGDWHGASSIRLSCLSPRSQLPPSAALSQVRLSAQRTPPRAAAAAGPDSASLLSTAAGSYALSTDAPPPAVSMLRLPSTEWFGAVPAAPSGARLDPTIATPIPHPPPPPPPPSSQVPGYRVSLPAPHSLGHAGRLEAARARLLSAPLSPIPEDSPTVTPPSFVAGPSIRVTSHWSRSPPPPPAQSDRADTPPAPASASLTDELRVPASEGTEEAPTDSCPTVRPISSTSAFSFGSSPSGLLELFLTGSAHGDGKGTRRRLRANSNLSGHSSMPSADSPDETAMVAASSYLARVRGFAGWTNVTTTNSGEEANGARRLCQPMQQDLIALANFRRGSELPPVGGVGVSPSTQGESHSLNARQFAADLLSPTGPSRVSADTKTSNAATAVTPNVLAASLPAAPRLLSPHDTLHSENLLVHVRLADGNHSFLSVDPNLSALPSTDLSAIASAHGTAAKQAAPRRSVVVVCPSNPPCLSPASLPTQSHDPLSLTPIAAAVPAQATRTALPPLLTVLGGGGSTSRRSFHSGSQGSDASAPLPRLASSVPASVSLTTLIEENLLSLTNTHDIRLSELLAHSGGSDDVLYHTVSAPLAPASIVSTTDCCTFSSLR